MTTYDDLLWDRENDPYQDSDVDADEAQDISRDADRAENESCEDD